MTTPEKSINAVVTGVYPNKVQIEIADIESFKVAGEKLTVGAFLRISDSDDCAIIAVIQNGMNLTGVESYTQKVVLGVVILGAVLLDTLKRGGGKRLLFWRRSLRT